MKNQIQRLSLIFVALIAAAGFAFGDAAATHVYVEIKGMACPFCVQGVEKHLKKIDGVESVATSLEKGETILHLKPGASVTEEQVQAAVKKAGFSAGKIRIEKGNQAAAQSRP